MRIFARLGVDLPSIVAELIGTMTGISYFINQQARYRNYQNVFAAIFLIGFHRPRVRRHLAQIGAKLFPWRAPQQKTPATALFRRLVGGKKEEPDAPTTQPA